MSVFGLRIGDEVRLAYPVARRDGRRLAGGRFVLPLYRPPAWASLSIPNHFKEQVFEGRRWAANFDVATSVPLNDRPNLRLGSLGQASGPNLGDVRDSKEFVDPAKFFQFALMKHSNPVTDVLHIGQ